MSKKSLLDLAKVNIATPSAPNSEAAPTAAPQNVVDQEMDDLDEEFHLLKNNLPKGVDIRSAIDFGFYVHRNRYWMRRKGDTFEPISNFIIDVKFLIVSANPKRIVEMKNVYGKTATLDFMIEDLISLDKFHARVQGQGNFLFEGNARDLARIKSKLFNMEQPSVEIGRLGQYKDKFFVFANGIYTDVDNVFHPIDENGMVVIEDQNYYIPVFGATRNADDDDLRNYRKFLHTESETKFKDWAKLFHQVFDENGVIGLSYLLYALFSDIVFDKTKAAPMLFLFGQRSSGKGTMANSMLYAFGSPQDPLMLGGASTVVGFMRKLGQFSNALVWLDEYKNEIDPKKVESLKNIWDRIGYERGVKDSSNRTQSTPVTSSAMVSGQEMPNIEPALFSRMVLTEFRNGQRDQEAIDRFNKLRTMENQGITSVTLEILKHRETVKAQFTKEYNEIATVLRSAFANEQIVDRMIVNFSILITMVKIMGQQLELPFTWEHTLVICEKSMKRQSSMMSTANEVQQFWEMVYYLLSTNLIVDGKDIMVKEGLIKIRLATIVALYREYSRKQAMKSLDRGTLVNYLQNSAAYCEEETKKSSHRFTKLENPTNAMVFLQHQIQEEYGLDFKAIIQNDDNQPFIPNTDPKQPF
jgi:hypothetical protein